MTSKFLKTKNSSEKRVNRKMHNFQWEDKSCKQRQQRRKHKSGLCLKVVFTNRLKYIESYPAGSKSCFSSQVVSHHRIKGLTANSYLYIHLHSVHRRSPLVDSLDIWYKMSARESPGRSRGHSTRTNRHIRMYHADIALKKTC